MAGTEGMEMGHPDSIQAIQTATTATATMTVLRLVLVSTVVELNQLSEDDIFPILLEIYI